MAPKSATTLRRASSLSKVSTPADADAPSPQTSTRQAKSSKSSKIIRLSLAKEVLLRFPHEKVTRKSNQAKSSSSGSKNASSESRSTSNAKSDPDSTSTIKEEDATSSTAKDNKSDVKSESKSGTKRGAGALAEGQENGKGTTQRKRPRTDPNKPDGRTAAAKAAKQAAGITTTAHKLGPKANQGAINAGLRALDRTNKQCRKWHKTGFRIKSFTGRIWELPSWQAPNSRAFGSESETGTSNGRSKENSSSNIGSDKSPAVLPSQVASSPAPVATPA